MIFLILYMIYLTLYWLVLTFYNPKEWSTRLGRVLFIFILLPGAIVVLGGLWLLAVFSHYWRDILYDVMTELLRSDYPSTKKIFRKGGDY